MSEEKTSQVNNKSHNTRKQHKHYAVLPYIITPVVFAVIALLLALPVGKVAFDYAVNTVHKAQVQLSMDFNDVEPDAVENENNTSIDNISVKAAQKIGTIVCEKAGINTGVYYGLNRVSLREGSALKTDASFPGSGKTVKIAGYRNKAFKNIGNLAVGDIITFETMWGSFDYEVYDIGVQSSSSEKEGDLVISTTVDSKPFSLYNEKQLYIYASPADWEVAQ